MTSTSDSDSTSSSSEHADVITQPGLYETRMGAIVEVIAEDSQSEGKQWVVRADGSPTYYTSDGRRVSYKGPGSEPDDPCQLMRLVAPPSASIADIVFGPILATDPITVQPGWWEMRDGEQIQVFEWKPDPPRPNDPFKWCGLTSSGDVIYWTDGGYCNFDASAATQAISDNDLVKFLGVPDSVQIRTLNETLQMKHEAIQDLEHDLAKRQKTIEAQAGAIQRLQANIDEKVLLISAARLSDLQERYNNMVVDRDEWCEKATQKERIISSNNLTIGSLQLQLSQMSKRLQSPAGNQEAIDGIAALRAEIDRLSAEKESAARLAVTEQEENDKLRQSITDLLAKLEEAKNYETNLRQNITDLLTKLEEAKNYGTNLRQALDNCLDANSGLSDELSRLRGNVHHPNLSLIVAKLTNPDNHQQQQIIVSGLAILSQLVRKNMDYGGSAFTPPILMPNVSPIVAMCCRASDKIARLANLLSGTRKQVESETVLDTIGDLAGYATLLYCYCNTIQGTSELEAIIEDASATTATTTATTTTTTDTTTTTNVTEERQV